MCCLPTPCHRLPRLSEELEVDLWIKRDDLTGFAMGGNKGRKLEFLMAEAVAQGADAVVTCGSAQSNFVRQLGAACSVLGMECHAAVMALPYSAIHGRPAHRGSTMGGNVLLGEWLDVQLHLYPDDDWEVLYTHAETIALELEESGLIVYRIPVGGSSPLGAYAFVRATEELGESFDVVVTPCSSGSTHTGLAYGLEGPRVIGVACDPEPEILDDLRTLLEGLHALIGEHDRGRLRTRLPELEFRLEWAGEAYGVPSPEGMAALELLAQTEGIFLDPIYSAKAFAGLLAMIRSGEVGGRVLFWHTGGLPAVFAEA